ncbi:hypothetical protein LTR36_006606 [Oleoguttula mirabilis]|uniref:DNA-directed RNA polymerase III subunit n=1 Tax=Oleoguttula mirabilis TaxID=1507867 RepID=A0AAV9JCP9_9PEZI|nr:hypothetical protein LTR36_006606 [Oleoguttula mirabilis]
MGGTMGGQKLPFDVDPDLEKEVLAYDAEGTKADEDDPKQAFVWPPYPGGVPRAPPVTERERRKVNIYRDMIARKHAGPHYTGPMGSLKALCNKRTAADFNAFEDQPTYGKKYGPKEFRLPDLTKVKFAAPYLFPREIWETIGYNPDADPDDPNAPPKKKLMLSKKTTFDKLARFDDDDEKGAGDATDDDDGEDKDDDDEADGDGPQDDDFDEDDEDDGDDYNAEQYFDGGDEDVEEAGGDEYAGDEGDDYDYKPRVYHDKRAFDRAAYLKTEDAGNEYSYEAVIGMTTQGYAQGAME